MWHEDLHPCFAVSGAQELTKSPCASRSPNETSESFLFQGPSNLSEWACTPLFCSVLTLSFPSGYNTQDLWGSTDLLVALLNSSWES